MRPSSRKTTAGGRITLDGVAVGCPAAFGGPMATSGALGLGHAMGHSAPFTDPEALELVVTIRHRVQPARGHAPMTVLGPLRQDSASRHGILPLRQPVVEIRTIDAPAFEVPMARAKEGPRESSSGARDDAARPLQESNGENQRIPRPCGDRRIESGEDRRTGQRENFRVGGNKSAALGACGSRGRLPRGRQARALREDDGHQDEDSRDDLTARTPGVGRADRACASDERSTAHRRLESPACGG